MIQTSNDSPSELTSTEKLVKCVVLHSIGGVVSLSCMMPSLDHPPIVWLLHHRITSNIVIDQHLTYFPFFKRKSQKTHNVVNTSPMISVYIRYKIQNTYICTIIIICKYISFDPRCYIYVKICADIYF